RAHSPVERKPAEIRTPRDADALHLATEGPRILLAQQDGEQKRDVFRRPPHRALDVQAEPLLLDERRSAEAFALRTAPAGWPQGDDAVEVRGISERAP